MGNKDRGSGTHGHGSSKKNRGAGSRGGRGKAGLGKKAKHKKQSVEPDYLGEKGFERPQGLQEEDDTINLLDIDQHIERFVEEGVAEEKDGTYIFDAEEAGFDKVLGKGRLTRDIDVKAKSFSSRAEEKIEENGNQAIKQD